MCALCKTLLKRALYKNKEEFKNTNLNLKWIYLKKKDYLINHPNINIATKIGGNLKNKKIIEYCLFIFFGKFSA